MNDKLRAQLAAGGNFSYPEIGTEFGVSGAMVGFIHRREAWALLPEEQ
jgi:hypothetical protein